MPVAAGAGHAAQIELTARVRGGVLLLLLHPDHALRKRLINQWQDEVWEEFRREFTVLANAE